MTDSSSEHSSSPRQGGVRGGARCALEARRDRPSHLTAGRGCGELRGGDRLCVAGRSTWVRGGRVATRATAAGRGCRRRSSPHALGSGDSQRRSSRCGTTSEPRRVGRSYGGTEPMNGESPHSTDVEVVRRGRVSWLTHPPAGVARIEADSFTFHAMPVSLPDGDPLPNEATPGELLAITHAIFLATAVAEALVLAGSPANEIVVNGSCTFAGPVEARRVIAVDLHVLGRGPRPRPGQVSGHGGRGAADVAACGRLPGGRAW